MSVRDSLKRLSGDSLVYGLGQVAGKIVNFLLVPVLTRVLVPEQFGVSENVTQYTASALLVLVFGMDGALARFFYEQPDRQTRVRMVSSSFTFRLLTGGAVALALAAFATPLAGALLGGEVYAKYLRIGALTLPATLFVLFSYDVLRVTFQPWKFIALNLTWTVTVGGLTLYFVLARHLGVAGALYGKLFGDCLTAAVGLVLCRHHLKPVFDRDLLRRMLSYGLPLVPVSISYAVIGAVDRATLTRAFSPEAAGVYAVAMKFFAVITMGVSAFNLAFGPFAYARAQDPDAPKLYARVFTLYVAIASLGALLVGVFAPGLVGLLATERYAAAAAPALWLTFAAVAQGAYSVAVLGITLALRTRLLGGIAALAAVVAIAANGVLVPRLGAEGAAMATCLAHVASAVAAYVVSQRVHPLPFRPARLAALFGGALAAGLLAVRFAPAGWAGVGVKLVAVLGFVALATVLEVWKDRGAVRHRPAA
ncbi:MAG: oligosaccharide flippase family protein [Candidatus Eisenbacteria bacterium]|uniref:Oligosaccharide flippase family protein n=1 Tax=Eiseniibacteriota bacterium TaxID=2212470 RepID=A0A933SDZ1_UNCEI|nr:oligosaccharide flippase family protein [Candidatus Eisenbacteria bacterium]